MKKRVLIITAMLITSFSVLAQKGHYLSLEGGIGSSGLKYDLNEGHRVSGLGYGGTIGYTYFFDKNWGVGIGAGVSKYTTYGIFDNKFERGSHAFESNPFPRNGELDPENFSKKYSFAGQVDSDGDSYRRHVYLTDWKEKQNTLMLEVPVTLNYQVRFGEEKRHGLYANIGVKAQLPIISNYEVADGTIDARGYFANGDVTFNSDVQDMSAYGYYIRNYDDAALGFPTKDSKEKVDLKFGVAGTAGLGFFFGVAKRLDLYIGGTFDYGFLNIYADVEEGAVRNEVIYREGTGATAKDAYNSMLASYDVEKINPVSIQGKVGLRWRIGGKDDVWKSGEEPAVLPEDPNAAKLAEATRQLEEATRNLEQATRNLEEAIKAGEEKAVQQQAEQVAKLEADKVAAVAKVIELDPVDNYEISATKLTRAQKQIVDRKITILKDNPTVKIALVGHTCDIDTETVNISIGQGRAQEVRTYLIESGIDASRIVRIETKGKATPRVSNSNEPNRKLNRRVEFLVVEQ